MATTIRDVQGAQTNAAGTTLALPTINQGVDGTLLVVALVTWDSVTIPTHQAPTDGNGNTYTQLGTTQAVPGGNIRISFWYAFAAGVSAALAITTHQSATTSARTAVAWSIGGPVAYNGDVGARTASSATLQPVDTVGGVSSGIALACYTNNVTATVSGPVDDNLSAWNQVGVNGFTSTMNTACGQEDNSTFQDVFTGYYLVDSSPEEASWSSTAANYAALIASFGSSAATPAASATRRRCRPFPTKPSGSRLRGRF
jgi:hypothetical protein